MAVGRAYNDGSIAKGLWLGETNRSSTKVVEDVLSTRDLSRGELVQALVVRIVHEVEDAVKTWFRTAIGATVSRASSGCIPLRRRIIHGIPWTTAACTTTLEDMEKTEPVAHLVNGSVAQLVVCRPSTGKRSCKVDTSIQRASQLAQAGGWEVACEPSAGS